MITKQLVTRAALTARARRLTAESGLGGFTVQQLCDDVGISRRTFFNYFPSKESAVLGIENGVDEILLDHFVTRRREPVDTRRHLLDDLVEIAIAHFAAMNPAASDLEDLVTALQREPKLITTMIASGRAEQRRFVDLVTETQAVDDPASAEVAVVTFEALVRLSVDTYLREGSTASFPEILRDRVESARVFFTPSLSPANTLEHTS